MDLEERVALRRRRFVVSFSIPLTLVELIDRMADHEGTGVSQVIERLVRRGLQQERDERKAKAEWKAE